MSQNQGNHQKTEGLAGQLRDTGRVILRSPALVRLAQWAIRFLLGAALAGGTVLGGAAPFGVALVGASGAGGEGFAALLGSVLGYLLCRGLEDGLRYAAAAILIFSVSFAFFDVKLYRKSWFMPVTAALLTGAARLITTAPHRWTTAAVAGLLGELTLVAAGVYIFRVAFSAWETPGEEGDTTLRQRVAIALLGVAVLLSLSELRLAGFLSLGRLLAVYGVLLAARAGGFGAGAAAGLVAGLAMDLSTGATPFYTMAYGLEGLLCGLLRRQGKVLFSLSGFWSTAALLLWNWELGGPPAVLYETALASLLFLCTPNPLLKRLAALFAGDGEPSRERWAAAEAGARLQATATAFSDLFSSLRAAFGKGMNTEDPAVIFDRAADRACRSCALRERCWQTGYSDTYTCLSDALPLLLEAGVAEPAHFPARFRDRCPHFSIFLGAVNTELAAHLTRRRYQAGLGDSRRAVCRQYGDVAQMLEETAQAMSVSVTAADTVRTRRLRQYLAGRGMNCQGLVYTDPAGRLRLQVEGRRAEELADGGAQQALEGLLALSLAAPKVDAAPRGKRVTYHQAPPFTALAGVAGRKKSGQGVSGDAAGWFKNEEETLYLLLCDGMGSGPDARREADLALQLLEKFLRAGVRPRLALMTLNEALALRGEETGGFSTIDLLELSLYTGAGTLYKLGAAPSYWKHGGSVTRLAGGSLPAGLIPDGRREPDQLPVRLDPGDCLVLLTDGVTAEGDQPLRAVLAEDGGDSPKALAEKLLSGRGDDDQTALVVRLGLRPGV